MGKKILIDNLFEPVGDGADGMIISPLSTNSVEECRAKLREHIADVAEQFRTVYRRELGTVSMKIATAEACGIATDAKGMGEFEGIDVRITHG
jgi:hypothetical protein